MAKISIGESMKSLIALFVFLLNIPGAKAQIPHSFVTQVTSLAPGHVACMVALGGFFKDSIGTVSKSSGRLVCDGEEIIPTDTNIDLNKISDINLTLSLIAKNVIGMGMHAGSCEAIFFPASTDGTPGIFSNACWFYSK